MHGVHEAVGSNPASPIKIMDEEKRPPVRVWLASEIWWYKSGHRIGAIISVFQTGETGSNPVARF